MARRRLRLKIKSESTGTADGEFTATATSTAPSTPESKSSSSPRSRKRREEAKHKDHPLWGPLQQLETMIQQGKLAYSGYEKDVEEFRALHEEYYMRSLQQPGEEATVGEWVLASRLQGIQNKQESSVGGRTHPYLKSLDGLVAHLNYPGWPQDFQAALQSHYHQDNDWNRQRALFRLQQKQCVFRGDRSHPRLVELDSVAAKLTYPGHARDVKQLEALHYDYTDDYIGNNVLSRQFQSLRHRQAHWDGTLTSCKELEALRSSLTYEGHAEDIQTAMDAHLQTISISESSGHVMDYATALQLVQHKQAFLQEGDRSHPRLVALDEVRYSFFVSELPEAAQENWYQMVHEIEQVHLRYATDDWIGNAIFEKLLQALKQLQKRNQRAMVKANSNSNYLSTPSRVCFRNNISSKSNNKKLFGSPSSVASTHTATTISSSWSHDSSDMVMADSYEHPCAVDDATTDEDQRRGSF